jgi:hypothetical protein
MAHSSLRISKSTWERGNGQCIRRNLGTYAIRPTASCFGWTALMVESYSARHASVVGYMRTSGMIGGLGLNLRLTTIAPSLRAFAFWSRTGDTRWSVHPIVVAHRKNRQPRRTILISILRAVWRENGAPVPVATVRRKEAESGLLV